MIILSNSKIKAWKSCPQKYYYKEVEQIEPRLSPLALQRGVLIHSMLEYYYNKQDWRKPLREFRTVWDNLMEEEQSYYGGDLPDEAQRIMESYINKYQGLDEKILAVELSFRDNPVEILPGIAFKGVIDLIIKNNKGTWLVEHKTHKRIPSEEQRFLDTQTVIYTLVAEKLGYKVDGILWNYIRTKPPTIPKTLVKGGISRAQDIDTDYDTYLKAIIQAGENPEDYKQELQRTNRNEFFVRKYMPTSPRVIQAICRDLKIVALQMDKLRDYPFRTLDKMTCSMCSYKSLCQAELLGLDSQLLRKFEFKKIEKEVIQIEED